MRNNNYPMKIEEAVARVEYNGTVSVLDNRTTSIKILDPDLFFSGDVIEHFSDFSDKVFDIISRRYWQEIDDDIQGRGRQIDYDYFTGGHYEFNQDLQDNEALITAKVRDIGSNSDFDLLLEVKVTLPDNNVLN